MKHGELCDRIDEIDRQQAILDQHYGDAAHRSERPVPPEMAARDEACNALQAERKTLCAQLCAGILGRGE